MQLFVCHPLMTQLCIITGAVGHQRGHVHDSLQTKNIETKKKKFVWDFFDTCRFAFNKTAVQWMIN